MRSLDRTTRHWPQTDVQDKEYSKKHKTQRLRVALGQTAIKSGYRSSNFLLIISKIVYCGKLVTIVAFGFMV